MQRKIQSNGTWVGISHSGHWFFVLTECIDLESCKIRLSYQGSLTGKGILLHMISACSDENILIWFVAIFWKSPCRCFSCRRSRRMYIIRWNMRAEWLRLSRVTQSAGYTIIVAGVLFSHLSSLLYLLSFADDCHKIIMRRTLFFNLSL